MLYLLFSVLCSVVIGNMIRIFVSNSRTKLLSVFLGNYIVAAIFSLVLASRGSIKVQSFDMWFAVIAGALFLANFLLYQKNVGLNGLSLSVGTMRSGIVIPTLVTVLWFPELFPLQKVIGLGFVILAFLVFTDRKNLHSLYWLLALFIVSGLTETSLKLYQEFGRGEQNMFFFVLFGMAGLFTLGSIYLKNERIDKSSLLKGFTLGIPNQLSSVFFLMALRGLPATVAYPVLASGIVILCLISDVVIWKKRFGFQEAVMLTFLMIGIILLNLY